jgi:hypothetical protein
LIPEFHVSGCFPSTEETRHGVMRRSPRSPTIPFLITVARVYDIVPFLATYYICTFRVESAPARPAAANKMYCVSPAAIFLPISHASQTDDERSNADHG